MFDREFIAALAMCAIGLAVAGVAAARPAPAVVTLSQAGAPIVTVFETETQRPGFTSMSVSNTAKPRRMERIAGLAPA